MLVKSIHKKYQSLVDRLPSFEEYVKELNQTEMSDEHKEIAKSAWLRCFEDITNQMQIK